MLAIFRGFGHKSNDWRAIRGLRLRNEADDWDDRKSGTSSGKGNGAGGQSNDIESDNPLA